MTKLQEPLTQSYRGLRPDADPQVLSNGRKQALGRESAETDLLSSYILPNFQTEAWQLTDLVCAEGDAGLLEMALFQCSQEMGKITQSRMAFGDLQTNTL